MKNFWDHIKDNALISEIPKHLKSLFFLKLMSNAREFIKRWVYTDKLKIEYPDDETQRAEFEKSSMFKNFLNELIKEIMVNNSDLTYLLQYGIL